MNKQTHGLLGSYTDPSGVSQRCFAIKAKFPSEVGGNTETERAGMTQSREEAEATWPRLTFSSH